MSTYWLNTATGKRFDFNDPKPEDIDIVDIAVALSHQCRYAGHTRKHWSVARHSILVARAVELVTGGGDPVRWALLHDAAEAYVTDIPWPLKAAGLVDALGAVEKRIMAVIAARFWLSPVEPPLVKEVDLEMLDLEADALLVRHADWPKGTPRAPRREVRTVCDDWDWSEVTPELTACAFMRFAQALDLANAADFARLVKLQDRR